MSFALFNNKHSVNSSHPDNSKHPAAEGGELPLGLPLADGQSQGVLTERLAAAYAAGSVMAKTELVELFRGWVLGSREAVNGGSTDEFAWFISKRAHLLIDSWLLSKRFAALEPRSPAGAGLIVITSERVAHVHDSRTNKDAVSPAGVVELLGQLFANGNPKYAPNPNYSGQLLMFDPGYKATDPAARGEAPCAVLQFNGESGAHLRLVTAYWMKPAKTKKLLDEALSKGGDTKGGKKK